MATVFLDLDGTLIDPKPGITRSIAYAMEKLGLQAPHADALEWAIGPALLDSFARLGIADPQRAVALYRERYTDVGLYEARVYDGIPEVLRMLTDAGYRLCLATAKPHAYAHRVTAHFGLAPFLTHEFGPELDGTRNDKGELLAHALALTGIDPAQAVMVGDRHYDSNAARAVGMASIAVHWGYGSAEEHGVATRSCETPGDLPGLVAELV